MYTNYKNISFIKKFQSITIKEERYMDDVTIKTEIFTETKMNIKIPFHGNCTTRNNEES